MRILSIWMCLALLAYAAAEKKPAPAARVVKRTVAAAGTNAVVVATQMVVRVTGYCNCGACCGWKRSWFGFGRPVYTSGPLKGKPKKVGVTARGTVARRGTIAADPKVFPFGTRLRVPGYGEGVVEDVGGAVVGRHIDVWFPSHDAARRWGTKRIPVEVLRTVEKPAVPR
ncbi:MAG: 3D domain-containing protein [Kiritimatiellia bacterium]